MSISSANIKIYYMGGGKMNIKRTDNYDFVVCGGGVAGFAAAVSAARKGLRVALIEKTPF